MHPACLHSQSPTVVHPPITPSRFWEETTGPVLRCGVLHGEGIACVFWKICFSWIGVE